MRARAIKRIFCGWLAGGGGAGGKEREGRHASVGARCGSDAEREIPSTSWIIPVPPDRTPATTLTPRERSSGRQASSPAGGLVIEDNDAAVLEL